jgi:restriction system protein
MTNDYSGILGSNVFSAQRRIDEAFAKVKQALVEVDYQGIFEAPLWTQDFGERWNELGNGALALDLGFWRHAEATRLFKSPAMAPDPVRYLPVDWILAGAALLPPHGLEVLNPPPFPVMPMPTVPELNIEFGDKVPQSIRASFQKSIRAFYEKQCSELMAEIESVRRVVAENVRNDQANIERAASIAVSCKQGDLSAIRALMLTTLRRHPLPGPLASVESDFALDVDSRVALCTFELPDFTKLPIVKKGAKWTAASEAQRKRASDHILHALCIRAAYLVAVGDPGDFFDTVAVNARQKWFDPATGHPKDGIVASLQAPKHLLRRLEPERLDPTACFRHLSGISSPNLLNATPIRPIFVMNINDSRIVASKDVTPQLQEATNLAAIPWEDFEHLVSQIFEWLFANDGVEVKVTRASRDRGVDAIMFDPDPIRGGKYVLQAKRYTHTVDLAAVRDLYGTVINEGANRGILVTTASYGPDAYEFAKDKPISLIDGPNLIALLKKHGRIYRIDLEEARRSNYGSL